MSLDKIPEDRLFQNNSREEISRWGNSMSYFHYMRSRGGHNCEGDAFCTYFLYQDMEDLISKLSQLHISLNKIEEGDIVFDPLESYSIDDLDKLRITIKKYADIEQPQSVEIFGYKVHVWVNDQNFEISISGTEKGKAYKVTENDYNVCLALEKKFDVLGWKIFLDDSITNEIHCISKKKYPELF